MRIDRTTLKMLAKFIVELETATPSTGKRLIEIAITDIIQHINRRLKCQRLFRPQFRKVKPIFFAEIREVSDTLTPNAGV